MYQLRDTLCSQRHLIHVHYHTSQYYCLQKQKRFTVCLSHEPVLLSAKNRRGSQYTDHKSQYYCLQKTEEVHSIPITRASTTVCKKHKRFTVCLSQEPVLLSAKNRRGSQYAYHTSQYYCLQKTQEVHSIPITRASTTVCKNTRGSQYTDHKSQYYCLQKTQEVHSMPITRASTTVCKKHKRFTVYRSQEPVLLSAKTQEVHSIPITRASTTVCKNTRGSQYAYHTSQYYCLQKTQEVHSMPITRASTTVCKKHKRFTVYRSQEPVLLSARNTRGSQYAYHTSQYYCLQKTQEVHSIPITRASTTVCKKHKRFTVYRSQEPVLLSARNTRGSQYAYHTSQYYCLQKTQEVHSIPITRASTTVCKKHKRFTVYRSQEPVLLSARNTRGSQYVYHKSQYYCLQKTQEVHSIPITRASTTVCKKHKRFTVYLSQEPVLLSARNTRGSQYAYHKSQYYCLQKHKRFTVYLSHEPVLLSAKNTRGSQYAHHKNQYYCLQETQEVHSIPITRASTTVCKKQKRFTVYLSQEPVLLSARNTRGSQYTYHKSLYYCLQKNRRDSQYTYHTSQYYCLQETEEIHSEPITRASTTVCKNTTNSQYTSKHKTFG